MEVNPELTLEQYLELANEVSDEAKSKFDYRVMVSSLDGRQGIFDPRHFYIIKNERVFIEATFNIPIKMQSLINSIENEPLPDVNQESSDVGWKAHISVDDSNIENLALGWNIVKEILIEEKFTAKVVKPNVNFYADNIQHGKQITLYCCSDPDKNWEAIFKRIEYDLVDANVLPDRNARGDNQIQGSRYITYRNDNRGDGTYISSEEANFNYNYCNAEDSYLRFNISRQYNRLR